LYVSVCMIIMCARASLVRKGKRIRPAACERAACVSVSFGDDNGNILLS
jgi:hypothetical protein